MNTREDFIRQLQEELPDCIIEQPAMSTQVDIIDQNGQKLAIGFSGVDAIDEAKICARFFKGLQWQEKTKYESKVETGLKPNKI